MSALQQMFARSAWSVFLVLFVARAVAGPVVCEVSAKQAIAVERAQVAAARGLAMRAATHAKAGEYNAQAGQRSGHGTDDVVCDVTVFASAEPQSLTAAKRAQHLDLAPGWPMLAVDCSPAAVATHATPREWAAQPLSSWSPLMVSPRLRL